MRKKPKTSVPIRYFQSYTDDFITSRKQNYRLPAGYSWASQNGFSKKTSVILYVFGLIFSFFYCSLYLHLRIKNRIVLKRCGKSGYFLFGNHTQPLGDACIPGRITCPKKANIVISPANLGIPLLGRLLPALGALPLPSSLTGMKEMTQTMKKRIQNGQCIVIYPEAHVWPWYTDIRPYSPVSFSYPVQFNCPVICMTSTYQKQRFRQRPRMTLYLDGPFYPDRSRSKKDQKEQLCQQVYGCMAARSKNSNYQYIRYEKGET